MKSKGANDRLIGQTKTEIILRPLSMLKGFAMMHANPILFQLDLVNPSCCTTATCFQVWSRVYWLCISHSTSAVYSSPFLCLTASWMLSLSGHSKNANQVLSPGGIPDFGSSISRVKQPWVICCQPVAMIVTRWKRRSRTSQYQHWSVSLKVLFSQCAVRSASVGQWKGVCRFRFRPKRGAHMPYPDSKLERHGIDSCLRNMTHLVIGLSADVIWTI
jgi:hypothetical protein